jgi:hypothetical protein
VADWTEEEAGPREAARELGRLFRRALARPLWTVGLALSLAALLVAREARKVQFYSSRVVFRGAGGDPAELGRLVAEKILDDDLLLDLMKRHHINPRLVEDKPLDAVAWLRQDVLGLRAWRNEDGEARLSLSFLHKDPKVAYEVVCDLVELVEARTANVAVARADRELHEDETRAAETREELFAARAGLARKELSLLSARNRAPLVAEIEQLRVEAADAETRLAHEENATENARYRAQAARRELGVRFEVVEPPRPAPLVREPWKRLVRLGSLAFLLLLPLAAMAVGAGDPVVRDGDDLRRLGLRPLGHVPGFPGDQVGSLKERERRYTTRP